MRIITTGLLIFLLFSSSSCDAAVDGVSVGFKQTQKRNKFRERDASDDELGFPQLDEDSLLNTKCPRNVELRWKAEVSSSIYATPLIADINSNGRIEVVVPSFVHYLEVLEGSDGDKLSGWPVFHQSKVLSSPLLYDIDKDGRREIALSTYNGVINFFRVSGYMMMDKLEVPHRVVRRNWYTELHPDNVDHLHSDVHDDLRVPKASDINSMPHGNIGSSVDSSVTSTPGSTISSSINASKLENGSKEKSAQARKSIELPNNLSSTTLIDVSLRGVKGETGEASKKKLLQETDPKEVQNVTSKFQANVDAEMHAEAAGKDEDPDVDSSFDLFQEAEEQEDKSNYDYDDYVDESMWGDEEWTGERHEKMEEYVNIDSHILCTPVIADIDNDGIQDMIVAVSYFFDHEYYEKPEHLADLGGINITKYAASSIVVFDLDTRLVKWTADLDLSVNTGTFRAYISSSPTVVDLDGDGNLDILVGTTSGLFYILDHRGKVREKFPLEMAEIKGPVVAADINDDGTIEIVTTDSNGNVAAWNAQGEEIWEVHLKSLISQGPTIGDVNGDGHSDVVIPTMSGNIYVLSGRDGSFVRPFPYRTGGAVMTPVLLVDLSKNDGTFKGLTLVTTSFDGYLYLIDGATACADVVDIGETSYSMVLADNLDGDDDADQDDIDLVVSTMNGNVFCFSTPSPHHPLKEWRSPNQGRNNIASRYNREGIYVSHASRAFRDEGGKHFWVDMEIIDKCRVPSGYHGPYNVTTTLLLPGNYRGERRIAFNNVYDQPGKHRIGLPTVPVQTSATVLVEMVDKNGLYFSDEFSLTFHLHYYALLKWLLVVPMLGMVGVVVTLHPQEGARLPSFSQSTD